MKFAHSWKMSRRTQKNGGWKSWKWLGGDQDGRPQKQNDSHYTRATEKPGERERNDCREVKLSTNPNKTTGWKGFHPKPSVILHQTAAKQESQLSSSQAQKPAQHVEVHDNEGKSKLPHEVFFFDHLKILEWSQTTNSPNLSLTSDNHIIRVAKNLNPYE